MGRGVQGPKHPRLPLCVLDFSWHCWSYCMRRSGLQQFRGFPLLSAESGAAHLRRAPLLRLRRCLLHLHKRVAQVRCLVPHRVQTRHQNHSKPPISGQCISRRKFRWFLFCPPLFHLHLALDTPGRRVRNMSPLLPVRCPVLVRFCTVVWTPWPDSPRSSSVSFTRFRHPFRTRSVPRQCRGRLLHILPLSSATFFVQRLRFHSRRVVGL